MLYQEVLLCQCIFLQMLSNTLFGALPETLLNKKPSRVGYVHVPENQDLDFLLLLVNQAQIIDI